MKYAFLALLSLSIASDVSIDINYAGSSSSNTEVVIETKDQQIKVSVDDYSYADDYSSYSGATAYVNSDKGNAATDELTVGYETYTSNDYNYDYAYAYTAEGDYVYVDQYSAVSDDGQGNVNTTYEVTSYTYNATTGASTNDYVIVDTYASTADNVTEVYSETSASVDNVYYEEEAVVATDNQSGEGYGNSEFGFWINAQALNNKTFGDFAFAFLILIVLGAAVVLACGKILQETQKMHDVTSLEPSASYIRI